MMLFQRRRIVKNSRHVLIHDTVIAAWRGLRRCLIQLHQALPSPAGHQTPRLPDEWPRHGEGYFVNVRQEHLMRTYSPRDACRLDAEYCMYHHRAGSIVECSIRCKPPVDPTYDLLVRRSRPYLSGADHVPSWITGCSPR